MGRENSLWRTTCPSCGHDQAASRTTCERCDKPVGGIVEGPAPQPRRLARVPFNLAALLFLSVACGGAVPLLMHDPATSADLSLILAFCLWTVGIAFTVSEVRAAWIRLRRREVPARLVVTAGLCAGGGALLPFFLLALEAPGHLIGLTNMLVGGGGEESRALLAMLVWGAAAAGLAWFAVGRLHLLHLRDGWDNDLARRLTNEESRYGPHLRDELPYF